MSGAPWLLLAAIAAGCDRGESPPPIAHDVPDLPAAHRGAHHAISGLGSTGPRTSWVTLDFDTGALTAYAGPLGAPDPDTERVAKTLPAAELERLARLADGVRSAPHSAASDYQEILTLVTRDGVRRFVADGPLRASSASSFACELRRTAGWRCSDPSP